MARVKKPAKDPLLIADPAALGRLAARLQKARRIGLDTESASFHRYVDRVYLIQVSSDLETALIDPLAVNDLGPIGNLLSTKDVEVVVHDADYDLRTLNRDYGFNVRNLFDTKVAAELLGEPAVGLGPLLAKYFGVQLDKRLQRADWSKRPLTKAMIAYAAADTAHLTRLRDELADHLSKRGRLEWAHEEFARLERVRWNDSSGNRRAFLKLKGAKALKGRSSAVLRSLYGWREQKARSLNRPPFKVLANNVLVALATAAPTTERRLSSVPGLPASIARRYGAELSRAIKKGLATPREKWPKREPHRTPKPDSSLEPILHRLKDLRNRRAEEIELPSGVLCPNGTLLAIVRKRPRSVKELTSVTELRRWQQKALGEEEVLAAVKEESKTSRSSDR